MTSTTSLVCEPSDKKILWCPSDLSVQQTQEYDECLPSFDDNGEHREYKNLTQLSSNPSTTMFKESKTTGSKTGDDVALAIIFLGGGFLAGGPLGLGLAALTLTGCYGVEDVGGANQSNHGSPQAEGEAEAESEGQVTHGTEGEAESEGQVNRGTGGEAESEGAAASGTEAESESEVAHNTWIAIPTDDAPLARQGYTAVSTGSEMIVWGGWGLNSFGLYQTPFNTGDLYDPVENRWTPTSIMSAPLARENHTAVWTGSEMIVWGGWIGEHCNTGGLYNPRENSWRSTSMVGAPSPREEHTAIWTGSEMIVWGGLGGLDSSFLSTGGLYDPATDSWTPTSIASAPLARDSHTAIWTGSQMIVWGGWDAMSHNLNTGGLYNPATDRWTPTSVVSAPSARHSHTAVWTGSEMIMIVWDGWSGDSILDTGGLYNPATDSWTPTSIAGAPSGRMLHTAVWTGSEMIVWGGLGDLNLNTGGSYNPVENSWTPTSIVGAPSERHTHTAVWTRNEMMIWGGWDDSGALNTGGQYTP